METEPKPVYWQRHIDDWLKSPLHQREYCEKHNLSYARFGYWRTRLKRAAPPKKKLVPVTITHPSASVGVFLPGGIRLEVSTHDLAAVLPVIYQTTRALS